MTLQEAIKLANELKTKLEPHCVKIEIAGSIRRQKEFVGDIELVVIPKRELDLFGSETGAVHPDFVNAVNSIGHKELGDPSGKYVKIYFGEHETQLDLFITTESQFGLIFCIRTGSKDFTTRMVMRLNDMGLQSKDGFVIRKSDNSRIECPDEETLFKLLEWQFVEPKNRR